MKKFISYPSIKQYRNVVKNINYSASYVGHDEEKDEPIFDCLLLKPKVIFKGTVKLHGTNASVCWNLDSGIWAQSRKNIITPEKDNAGFAAFVYDKMYIFQKIMGRIEHFIDIENRTISIFGEWCGQGIQKGVAISEVEKMFVIFGVKVTPFNDEESAFWIDYHDLNLSSHEDRIYDINEFPNYEIEIDFNKPEEYQNQLNEITQQVEEKCPVAAHFGVDGIGEGIVWEGVYKDSSYRFKVKGDKHSISKVKKLPKVDDEKISIINEVVNKITPSFRLEQGIVEVFDTINGGEVDRKKLGDYIRWVISDIMKEDLDLIMDAGLEPKDVNPKVSKVVKDHFFRLEQLK